MEIEKHSISQKNAILLHGTCGNPGVFWFPSIKQFLENLGYKTWVPQLPDACAPNLKKQLPFVLERGEFTHETIIVGHSAGCPLILSVLENIDIMVKKVILVAGYAKPVTTNLTGEAKELEKEALKILQEEYDWKKIASHVDDLIFINSDNDPWGCDDKEGRYMFDHLGGTLIIRQGEGHMGTYDFGQPYPEFPLLEKLLEIE
jgi:uncharacterized protein